MAAALERLGVDLFSVNNGFTCGGIVPRSSFCFFLLLFQPQRNALQVNTLESAHALSIFGKRLAKVSAAACACARVPGSDE